MDVSKIPFSIRSTFDDSDEQLKAFNTLFLSVIAVHPFLKILKTTRPEQYVLMGVPGHFFSPFFKFLIF